MFTTILTLFGVTISSIFAWVWVWFKRRQAAETQAAADMSAAIQQHADDGVKSVADMNSAEQQLENIKAQEQKLNNSGGLNVPPGV